ADGGRRAPRPCRTADYSHPFGAVFSELRPAAGRVRCARHPAPRWCTLRTWADAVVRSADDLLWRYDQSPGPAGESRPDRALTQSAGPARHAGIVDGAGA